MKFSTLLSSMLIYIDKYSGTYILHRAKFLKIHMRVLCIDCIVYIEIASYGIYTLINTFKRMVCCHGVLPNVTYVNINIANYVVPT